jgi:starch synthase (maltosyl-transferring)
MGHGIRVFRVDNPHTKAFAFWEWLIGGVKAEHPDVLFLAEAFTRPRVMQRLAKLGFSQSYTYFTWRTTKAELTDYATELTATPLREFFRPNFWPNTPDILAMQLQAGGRPSFIARLILAATLVGSYGIYGPPFEMGEDTPVAPGSEEYLHSEKYEIRTWNLDRPDSLAEVIATVNRIRRAHPALQGAAPPRFVPVDNDALLAYAKATADDAVLVIVNLDSRWPQSGWVNLPLAELGLPDGPPYDVVDLLTGARFTWAGARNYVRLDTAAMPAHILQLQRPPTPAHGA